MVMIAKQKYKVIQQTNREDNMSSFYYDVNKLKREWSEDNLKEWGKYIAEGCRSDNLYKDGWSTSELNEFENDECSIDIKWGVDEEGYKQEWSDNINITKEDWFKEYDKHFPKKQAQANK